MESKKRAQEQRRFDELYQSLFVDDKMMFAGTLLERAARLWPHRIALLCKDESITYQELYRRASLVTKRLQAYGVRQEDRVCLWYENSIEFFIGYYGIWQTGAIVAALNVFLHQEELVHILKEVQPKAFVISTMLLEQLSPVVRSSLPFFLDSDFIINTQKVFHEDECIIPYKGPDEVAVFLHTAGTTGMPKGVMISSKNIFTNIIQGLVRLEVNKEDRVYMPVPLFHSLAQNSTIWCNFFLGASAVIIPKIERHFLKEGFLHKPTVVIGVPALYGIFCLMKNLNINSVRYFISGGDAMPDKIRTAFALLYHRKIASGYGLSETSPLVAAHVTEEYVSSDTVGIPVVGLSCSLRDAHKKEVKKGDVGTLWVKGDNVMLGYYKSPELTHKVMKDGWLDTGDLARFDAQGRLHIVGREKDLIINKGFNIFPQEIENVLLTHPLIMQAAVIGVHDGGLEEIPVACIVIKGTIKQLELELRKYCLEHLALYKIPRRFIVYNTLPMTLLGKIDKKALRADYEQRNAQKD